MNLTEEQRQRVAAWINEGNKLAQIQARLASEFGVKVTYLEARFLVDDLKLTPKDPEPVKAAATSAILEGKPAEPAAAAAPAQPETEEPTAAIGGKVSVSVDQIARPGAIVSGKVTFSDGQTAEWYLDQTGRLGVVPKQTGYKPSAADVQDFQLALQQEIARLGY